MPHDVPKSACVCCPFRTNQEWKRLKDSDTEGWLRPVEIDHALRADGTVANRNLDQKLYLHRSCFPLDVIDFNQLRPEMISPMTVGECHGMCGV